MKMRELIKYYRDSKIDTASIEMECSDKNGKNYLAHMGLGRFGKDILVIEFDNNDEMHIGAVYRYDDFSDDETLIDNFERQYILEAEKHGLKVDRMIFADKDDVVVFE